MRLRLRIAYDGGAYHGWQRQPDVSTVEGELLGAAARMLTGGDEDAVTLQGASRTDAGVHALGQTAHLDVEVPGTGPWDLVRGLNALTPDDICVLYAEPAPAGFHARHDSRGKTYQYHIWNHRFPHPLRLERAWWVRPALDLERMRRAARRLEGEHDFAAFRASNCQAHTTTRRLRRVDITRQGAQVRIEIRGDAFLKYMVRIVTGTLVDIGRGHLAPQIIDEMFATGERARGGPTAPPQGLTLVSVHYPQHPWAWDQEPELGGPWLPPGGGEEE